MIVQAAIVLIASIVCQLLSGDPIENLLGPFNLQWLKFLFSGLVMGAVLMVAPAFILYVFGLVNWKINPAGLSSILPVTILFFWVAIAEELLFRGFLFQRLIASVGEWPAQLVIAGLFLLTHLNNPGMTGNIKILAGINIFLASVMFGLAFLRTKSLAMPIGLHFMANWMQGVMLGFGVSGNKQESILQPIFSIEQVSVTGGSFGLEASIPGLISVIIFIIVLYRMKPAITVEKTYSGRNMKLHGVNNTRDDNF
jgi:membrane protease YdiL (CAAX protease family)